MPSFVPPIINTSYTFYIGLISQTDTKILQLNPTLVAGDVKVAVNDAAPANLGTLPVVDADFTKRVKVVLSASEMNGDNVTVIFSDAAGAEWADLIVNFQTVARQVDDLAFPATAGNSIQVESDGMVHADIKEWLGAAPDALSSGKVAADLKLWLTTAPLALVSQRVDSFVGAMATDVLTAAAIQAAGANKIRDAILASVLTEPGQAIPPTTGVATLEDALRYLFFGFTNRVDVNEPGAFKEFFDRAGTTIQWKKAISLVASVYKENTGVSG